MTTVERHASLSATPCGIGWHPRIATDGLELFNGRLILAPRGRLGWLGVVAGIFGRNKRRNTSVEYFQGTAAEITLEHEQEFQLDGDHVGTGKHLAVTLEPAALKIRMMNP